MCKCRSVENEEGLTVKDLLDVIMNEHEGSFNPWDHLMSNGVSIVKISYDPDEGTIHFE